MRRTFRSLFMLPLVLLSASPLARAQEEQGIDLAVAQKYFQEAKTICEQDGGRLWGRTLCGPMIFFDPRTRMAVANQGDREGRLVQKGDVFAGRVPDEVNCANTAIEWAGVRWSMIFWPYLGDDRFDRDRLMTHESFHRIQNELGLPMSNPANNHLDSMPGRLWLQLEWRALAHALASKEKERRAAAEDALVFRLYRRTLFQQAATEERALEMNEGLAEYTGVRLSGRSEAELDAFMVGRLGRAKDRQSFTRSFAYESGPAYGLLLDGANSRWRNKLKASDDLGQLLQKSLKLKLPVDLKAAAEKRAAAYDGESLRAAEEKRESERLARIKAYRAKLVEGAVLILPMTQEANYSFDPNNLVPLEGVGTIYPTMRVTDAWGILEVDGGALMTRGDNTPSRLYVPVANDMNARPLRGAGWTLRLDEGWTLEPGERNGDYQLKKK